ncbi:MAG: asparaginase [Bacteriovorax sp.]
MDRMTLNTRSTHPLKVDVTRGPKVESQHLVDVVVMNADKKILASFGEIHEGVYPRSAIKMLQALLLVDSGAYSSLGLDLRHLALASSSHYADKVHTDLVHEWLQKLNLSEENLRCGAQVPSRESVRDLLIRQNLKPHRGHNNCSGKHCGILSVCRHKNYDIKNYDSIAHPVQHDLIKTLSEVYEYDLQKSPYGIDGCGIPTIAVPLYNLTLAHINLAKRDSGKLILEAIAKHPDLISGDANFCTEVTRATEGLVFAKTGAEGVFCALSPVHDIYLSLKVRDGATRASQFAIAALLKEFGCFTKGQENLLEKFLKPKIKNWEGLDVGEMRMAPHV